MDKFFFKKLRLDFKNKDIFEINKKSVQILQECSTGFLRGKLRYHPLGFLYYRLHTFSNEETIRIHFWFNIDNKELTTINIHNHFYIINSFVVCGMISNTLFQVISEKPHTHIKYIGSYGRDDERILTKGIERFQLLIKNSKIINEGNLYKISKNEVHRGNSINNIPTITLIYTENPGKSEPLVFGSIDGINEYKFSSSIVDIKKIIKIEKIIKASNKKYSAFGR